MDFPILLDKVQNYMAEKHKELMNTGDEESKPLMISHMRKYLTENRLNVDGMSIDEIIDRLYAEMVDFSFLTPYLDFSIPNVEGIEINSWEDIKIKLTSGREERANRQFFSPDHARDVLKRLLRKSGINMDPTHPLVRGHLGKNIRITVNGGGGTLDEDVGVAASIRFINPNHLTGEDIIKFGTLTKEMLDFLCTVYRYGLSEMLAGETDAGKTTLMSIIMASLPNEKKLYTIENGTREFDHVKRDKDGLIINNVIHTNTKESEDAKLAITPQMLLEQGMTMNPDYLCMAEVRGSESFETTEAALTGHPVIGTTHTYSAATIPDRLVQLASLKSNNLSDKTLYDMVGKAFPILFYSQKMADGVRRVTEICECQLENDRPKVIPLWLYKTEYNEEVDGEVIVHGQFEKCGSISTELQSRLRRKGIPEQLLKSFLS